MRVEPNKNYYTDYNLNSFFSIVNLQSKITKLFVDTDLLNAAVFWFTNVERQKYNLKQFQFHEKLRQAATLHSEQMKIHNFFDHENNFDARYKTLTNRIDAQKDSTFNGFMSYAENIFDYPVIEANTTFTVENRNGQTRFFLMNGKELLPYTYYELAKNVVDGWMNSPGHRANILQPDFEYLGCGSAKYEKQGNGYSTLYFKLTQNFGGSLGWNDVFLEAEKFISDGINMCNKKIKTIKEKVNQNILNPYVLDNYKQKFNSLLGDLGQKNKNNMDNTNDLMLTGKLTAAKRKEQLCVFLLDGSGSMDDIGEMNNTLAENVGRTFKDFMSFFKESSIKEDFQIAVINFDYEAVVRQPRIALTEFPDFENYNPRDIGKEDPGTNIGLGLIEAKKIIDEFLAEPNPDEYRRDAVIAILSDGMCQHPESTLKIARELDANGNIIISCGLFTTKEREDKYLFNKDAKNFLQDIKSQEGLYGVIRDNKTLRKWFEASSSTTKKKENK
ncbi:MAG: CAP domain-containing protein [Marinilabiliaceae bacterium]|nr:CAP domain-containing protein [Marinilabiliaceae bacterium]